MLSKELQILSQLDCECLVTLLGAFLESNTVTLVLEYMDYGSLDKLFLSMKHLPDQVSAAITFQALWGLSYLHYEHRLHRDIKPGNILLHSDGSVKLSDFGISAVVDSLKMNSTVVGTMKYMALERLRNKEYSKPSDVWSLGLVVWQCLTGSFCFCKLESVVELVVTLEDVVSSSSSSGDSLLSIMDNEFDDNVRELLEGFLQVRPEKRMPACVLLRSPWFESEGVTSLEEAKVVIREFLSQR
jgi:serine/threonine-protein kinase OSR1/STK39